MIDFNKKTQVDEYDISQYDTIEDEPLYKVRFNRKLNLDKWSWSKNRTYLVYRYIELIGGTKEVCYSVESDTYDLELIEGAWKDFCTAFEISKNDNSNKAVMTRELA